MNIMARQPGLAQQIMAMKGGTRSPIAAFGGGAPGGAMGGIGRMLGGGAPAPPIGPASDAGGGGAGHFASLLAALQQQGMKGGGAPMGIGGPPGGGDAPPMLGAPPPQGAAAGGLLGKLGGMLGGGGGMPWAQQGATISAPGSKSDGMSNPYAPQGGGLGGGMAPDAMAALLKTAPNTAIPMPSMPNGGQARPGGWLGKSVMGLGSMLGGGGAPPPAPPPPAMR